MCIIAIAYRVHPEYPLVVAANRDEFYDRPTAPLHYWEDQPDILAGRDLKNHGTWLGINKRGKVAAVTNYREPGAKPGSGISRGFLVRDYLARDVPPAAYLEHIETRKDAYGGFNLIVGSAGSLFWYSNRGGGITQINPGIHGLSNRLLNTPWPKVEKAREGLARIVDEKDAIDPEALFSMLKDSSRPPDDKLPDTGIDRQWERTLSPVFITSDIYGTRCSSVILVDASGKTAFHERTFVQSEPGETRSFVLHTETR